VVAGPQGTPLDYRSGARSGNLGHPAYNYIHETAMQEEDLPLPHGVHEKHGSWHFVQNNQWRKLCRVNEGRQRLYERLHEVTGGVKGMCWHAILAYIAGGMTKLAPATQKNYRQAAWRMLHHFGHFRNDDIEPTDCKQFLVWCEENTSALTGNRDKAFMSSVFEYAMGRGWAVRNPWRGIRRNKEKGSQAYVEHDSLESALNRAPPWIYGLFGTGYLTGMRQTDLMLFTIGQIKAEHIEWTESKTKKKNSAPLTKTLRHCLNVALLHKDAAAQRHEKKGRHEKAATVRALPHVFVTQRGLPWTVWGIQSALRRFKAGFQFRQLRPKAQTDRPDANILGHVGQMRERYTRRRKLDVVK
jgi:site-specific recombinase XerD